MEQNLNSFIQTSIDQGMNDDEILEKFHSSGMSIPQNNNNQEEDFRTNADYEEFEMQQVQDLKKHMIQSGQKVPDLNEIMGNEYEKFEDFQNKEAKMMYDRDQIIMDRLRDERIAEIDKEKRSIEPGTETGYIDVQAQRLQGVDEDYYDPRDKRRKLQQKYDQEKRD